MPDPVGVFYSASCVIGGQPGDALSPVNVATEEGLAALHAYVNEAIGFGATEITIVKSE